MPVDLARVGSWQSSGVFIALPLSDRLVGLQTALPVSVESRVQHLQPPEAAGLWQKLAWIFQKCYESLQ